MRILILGAGGVGGYYGGLLAKDGNEVFVVARGDNLTGLQENGLTVRDTGGTHSEFTVPVTAADSFEGTDLPPVDLVIVATKAYSTRSILEKARPLVGPNTIFLPLQNGVEGEEAIAEMFPDKTILGGLCYLGGRLVAPGVVEQTADGHIVFGALLATQGHKAEEVKAVLDQAGIKNKLSPDIWTDKWFKLAFITALNQLCAISNSTVGELLTDIQFEQAVRGVIEEVRQVAAARGVSLPADIADQQVAAARTKYANLRLSIANDLNRGYPTEHDAFSGYISREGKRLGVPTPLNDAIFALFNSGSLADPANRNPDTLRALLQEAQTPEPELFVPRYYLDSLDVAQQAHFMEMRAGVEEKRKYGILDYYREVTGLSEADEAGMNEQLLLWQAQYGGNLDIGETLDWREKYLLIRSAEIAKRGQEVKSVLLLGVPDAQENEMSVHVEIYRQSEGQPKGVVYFLAGYGETLAMADEQINHFVQKGYIVVAADQRAHGFSGNPLGVPGYMDSGANMVQDAQVVLDYIQSHSDLKDLPLFGFGFSQGGLFHTRLAQNNAGAYAGFSLVSPTHNLGRRFEWVTAPKLAETGAKVSDFTKLELDPKRNIVDVPFADPEGATKVRFGRTSQRLVAQKWKERGFTVPAFIIKDSSVVWDEAIEATRAVADAGRTIVQKAKVFVGANDDNIGREGVVLDSTRRYFSDVDSHVFAGQDHQLLLAGVDLSGVDVTGKILSDTSTHFDQIAATHQVVSRAHRSRQAPAAFRRSASLARAIA